MHAIAKDIGVVILSAVQYRKWSPTANDPETANDLQNGPLMILDRKWSLKSTANDPVKTWGMEWILWDWLQKRTDYKKETFFSRLLKKKGKRMKHLRSIFVAEKFKTGRTLRRKNSIILTPRSSTFLLRNTKPGTLYITRALLTLLIFLEVSN